MALGTNANTNLHLMDDIRFGKFNKDAALRPFLLRFRCALPGSASDATPREEGRENIAEKNFHLKQRDAHQENVEKHSLSHN
jgi:hypothetical protein